MDPGHHHHHLHPQYSTGGSSLNIDSVTGSDNRFPQWSIQETQELLGIRAELDPTFMETKRNKLLWDVISTRMKEKGYNRSAEQCKCKWKNLVTRYKGCEAMEAEGIARQQFPYYNELQAIFAARMQRMLWQEAEGGSSSRRKATGGSGSGSQFFSDEEDETEDTLVSEEGLGGVGQSRKKRKTRSNYSGNVNNPSPSPSGGGGNVVVIREMMEEFMRQQMQIETEWMRVYEKREEERRVKEMEWRQRMEVLENERLVMERRWREREEERRVREEERAEKRDALITTLLNRLRGEDHD